MSGENSQDSFSTDRAELFEALGHPTRIQILEVLANSPMGFSDLKKALGIDSGGQLQFHLGKLHGLVKTVEGNYALTDEGKEALRIIAAKGLVKTEPKTRHFITPLQVITIVLAIALAFTVAFGFYNNQLQNQNFNNLNQSYVVLDQLYNEHNLQFNNLLNQFYSGGIVADLSTSDEFRSVAKEMGAKYFSINPDTGYNDRGTIINGYIWDENGTFILTYSASVDFITFKVSNVGVLEPVCLGCPENISLAIPSMSDYVTYTIQSSSFSKITHLNLHLLTSQEIAQLYPNLPSAEQLWNNGTGTWINPLETQSEVIIHFGNNATGFIAGAVPSDEIMNYTEFIPDFYTGLYAGQYAHVWLQYNDTIWVEAPVVKVSN